MASNLIVYDKEYQNLPEIYEEIGIAVEEQLEQYLSIIQTICDNAVSDGYVHENLKAFLGKVQRSQGIVEALTKEFSKKAKAYQGGIDREDSYIY